jgi:hypothetical protein
MSDYCGDNPPFGRIARTGWRLRVLTVIDSIFKLRKKLIGE